MIRHKHQMFLNDLIGHSGKTQGIIDPLGFPVLFQHRWNSVDPDIPRVCKNSLNNGNLIPILFFSFPAQIYGWPTLGAIGKVRETTVSTVIAASVQVAGLLILIITDSFALIPLAILRGGTEAILLGIRMWTVYKNKKEFCR